MQSPPTYDERLGVPLRWWAQGTMFVASLWLALLVVPEISPWEWVVTGAAMLLLSAAFLSYGSARIEVTSEHLRAGRAQIARHHLGEVVPLDAEATRRVAGRDADARAYLLLRPYRKRAVRVEITDPADHTPYWLISTRHPERLAEALARP